MKTIDVFEKTKTIQVPDAMHNVEFFTQGDYLMPSIHSPEEVLGIVPVERHSYPIVTLSRTFMDSIECKKREQRNIAVIDDSANFGLGMFFSQNTEYYHKAYHDSVVSSLENQLSDVVLDNIRLLERKAVIEDMSLFERIFKYKKIIKDQNID